MGIQGSRDIDETSVTLRTRIFQLILSTIRCFLGYIKISFSINYSQLRTISHFDNSNISVNPFNDTMFLRLHKDFFFYKLFTVSYFLAKKIDKEFSEDKHIYRRYSLYKINRIVYFLEKCRFR